ncbi:LCP family protein [Nocardioides cavernaquae]|nr:LCP family protein [Nocardioides cavernaquae]
MSDENAVARHRADALPRHRIAKAFSYGIVFLTVGVMLFVSYTYRTLNGNLNVVSIETLTNRPVKEKVEGDRQPINVLVMGSDSRDGANNIDGLTGGGQRSDTTMLLHLSADRKQAYGVSLPRDAMVERPECKKKNGDVIPGGFAMWNDAFSYGGPLCTVQQTEQLTGIRIDHFVVVDFSGFKDMVDAVDGVEICVPEEVNDTHGNIHLDAGRREVRGKEALDYVRVRSNISANGDIGRMKRQQVFIASMVNKVLSGQTLGNPVRLINFLKAATKSLTVDKAMGNLKEMADLGAQFRDIKLSDIKFITVPWSFWPENPNRLIWKTEESKELWRKIRKDLPLSKRLSSEAVTADESPGASDKPSPSSSPSSSPSDEPSDEPTKSAEEIAEENGLCA